MEGALLNCCLIGDVSVSGCEPDEDSGVMPSGEPIGAKGQTLPSC